MTARILRIELRRSSALWGALVVAVVGGLQMAPLVTLFGPAHLWHPLVTGQRTFMIFFSALALGAGAWQARRDRSNRMEELLATTPRSRLSRAVPVALALALAMVAAYAMILAAMVAVNRPPLDAYFPVGAVPVIAIGALLLVALAWLGLGIGRQAPWRLVAPVLVVAGTVGMVVVSDAMFRAAGSPDASGAFLLGPTLPNPVARPIAYAAVGARTNLGQALWLAGLAATGLALFAATTRRARILALVPAVLGAAVAVPILPARLADTYVADRRASALVCTADAPTVCVERVESTALDDWRGPGRQAISVLAAKLPSAPDRVEVYMWVAPDVTAYPEDDPPTEASPGACPSTVCPRGTRPSDTLVFEFGFRGREAPPVPSHLRVWHLLTGAGVGMCVDMVFRAGAYSDGYLAARYAAAAWLMGQPLPSDLISFGGPDVGRLAEELRRTLSSLPADEQRDRVAALRQAELSCAPGDRAALLRGQP
jgi:hypothetical protein